MQTCESNLPSDKIAQDSVHGATSPSILRVQVAEVQPFTAFVNYLSCPYSDESLTPQFMMILLEGFPMPMEFLTTGWLKASG